MDLVAPIIPDAQRNRSPDILLEGLRGGLAAFATFANMKRESEMAVARIAQQERESQRGHDLDLKKIELQSSLNDSHAQMYDSYATLAEAKAKAYADGTATNAQRSVAFNKQMESLVNDFDGQADKLKLNDPQFAVKDPVQFAANVLKMKDSYRMASHIPVIKNALGQYQTIADQQKIRLRSVVRDENGAPSVSGEGKEVPIWQVVKRLQDPESKADALEELRMNGHITDQVTPGKKASIWGLWMDGTESVVKKDIPDAKATKILDASERVQFERSPSRVPPAMLPKSFAPGTQPTEMPAMTPDDDMPPQASYAPTDTDKLIAQAKSAIQRGASFSAVAQRLQERGVDPSSLWAT